MSAIALVFVALAAVSMLPSSADKINDLGYSSLCPFAPYSALALLVVAGIAWVIRMYLRDQAAGEIRDGVAGETQHQAKAASPARSRKSRR